MKQLRNWLRYIIVCILDIFVMVVFHSYLNFLILVVLVLLPFWSILTLKMVAGHLEVDVSLPFEPMNKGDSFFLRFHVMNHSIVPVVNATLKVLVENRFYSESGIHRLNIPLRGRNSTDIDYQMEMEYCGRLTVSVLEIGLEDLFGLYKRNIPISVEKECLIHPSGESRTAQAGMLYQMGVTEDMESRKRGHDFSEISGIREYIPGDKLQNIHWKLSVKKDCLMVKERISVSAMQLCVVVDLLNDARMCLEGILELTDGITKGFVEMNIPFTLYYYSVKTGQIKETLIDNEKERKNCFDMILYESCYEQEGLAEDLFLKQYTTSTYLYIGCGKQEAGTGTISMPSGVVAQIRTRE